MGKFVCLCLLLFFFGFRLATGKSVLETGGNGTIKSDEQKYYDLTVSLERHFKDAVRSVTKSMFPYMMQLREDELISGRCMQSLTKYVMALAKAKMWAVQMLDASSKLPSGLLIGTFADFGSFDECLDVEVLHRDGSLDFRGSSCSVEMRPPMPALKRRISLADKRMAHSEDTLGAQFREAYQALHHKHLKFIVCLPSSCSLEDVRRISKRITNETDFQIKIPECYVKEEISLDPIHIAVISCLGILLILGISGSIFESWKLNSGSKTLSKSEMIFAAFSLSSNFKRLISKPGGTTELKCVHGIRAISIFWVMLGHSYVYMDFEILKDPIHIQTWFGTLTFEFINNGWVAVETFFLLSGILVVYSGLKTMTETGGRLNLPLLIIRRYLRLTPSVLLLMGLVFFLPLLSSGPFWYEHVEPPLESCRKYWWTTLLYFSNWWGIDKGCIQTTWYLAADFQLHILSLFLLIALFRYARATVGFLIMAILFSCAAVGAQTWFWDLGATVQISTGDDDQVFETLNRIHIQTFTHLGPHCIGMAVGYYVFKYREKRLSKPVVLLGWCASVVLCVSSVLGSHRFAAGHETSEILSIAYAAIHRCAYTCGVAWVLLACITGYGGPVNALLSSSIMAPFSRLAYMVYLIHPLVIWTKLGSLRERPYASHYDFVYLYLTNAVVSIVLAVPFYLLLEAPLSNIERILNKRNPKEQNRITKEIAEKDDVTLTKVKVHLADFQPSPPTMSEKSNR